MARPSLLHHSRCLTKISFVQRRCLSLHEYQAQNLLAAYQIPVPRGWLTTTATEVANRIDEFGGHGVIKSQILAGGRGKRYVWKRVQRRRSRGLIVSQSIPSAVAPASVRSQR